MRVLKEGRYEAGGAFDGTTWPSPLADDVEAVVVRAAREVTGRARGGTR